MPTEHVVERGEYLAAIAADWGFLDYRTIWNDPANAELIRRRTNPQSLAPGDVLTVPDRRQVALQRPTDRMHRITVASPTVLLNFVFEDPSRTPYADRPGELRVAGRSASKQPILVGPLPRTTDGEGALSERIHGLPTEGEFSLAATSGADPEYRFRFLVGELEPVDTPAGMRARLNNLGYYAGFGPDDEAQLDWAVEEFQCDEKLPKKDRGLHPERKRNLATWNRLAQRHGDMLPGEEVT